MEGENIEMKSLQSYEYPIPGWFRLAYKDVRTRDSKKVGVVHAEDQRFIVVRSPHAREYKIPKSIIEVYDESKVLLGITAPELRRYGL